MPQPAPAPRTGSKTITITYANGVYTAQPPSEHIDNSGELNFNASQACRVCTSPTGVFGDSNGYIDLSQGNNGPYTPQQQNVSVSYCITDPNTTCSPTSPRATGGYTITVGSTSSQPGKR